MTHVGMMKAGAHLLVRSLRVWRGLSSRGAAALDPGCGRGVGGGAGGGGGERLG